MARSSLALALLLLACAALVCAFEREVTPLQWGQNVSSNTATDDYVYFSISTYQNGGGADDRVLYVQLFVERDLPLDDGSEIYLVASSSPSPTVEDAEYYTTVWDQYRFYEGEYYIDWSQLLLAIEAPKEAVWYIGVYSISSTTAPFTITAYFPTKYTMKAKETRQVVLPMQQFVLFEIQSASSYLFVDITVDEQAFHTTSAYLRHAGYPSVQVHDFAAERRELQGEWHPGLEIIARSFKSGSRWFILVSNLERMDDTRITFSSLPLAESGKSSGGGGSDDSSTVIALAVFVAILGTIVLVFIGILIGYAVRTRLSWKGVGGSSRTPQAYKAMGDEEF